VSVAYLFPLHHPQLKVVALHEIGHALGLRHSPTAADVMSPFYDEKQSKLSQNDIARVREAFA
jgi:predicted Zn-dependent protease